MKDEAIHQSIKQKIRVIAKETSETYNIIFTRLSLERFIVRLQNSEYKEKLIFKGGLCLNNIIEIGRETRDIDFLARNITNKKENFLQVFMDISKVIIDDGFSFQHVSISDLPNEKKKYPGFRIDIEYNFGQAKDKIQIDIGIGDSVNPVLMEFKTLKTSKGALILPKSLDILAYPPEFIFSEKLQAAVMLAGNNSRVKDYHDMFMLINSEVLNKELLKISIKETFKTRKTELSLIPSFNPTEQEKLHKYWISHYKVLIGTVKEILPPDFSTVSNYINNYLTTNNLI